MEARPPVARPACCGFSGVNYIGMSSYGIAPDMDVGLGVRAGSSRDGESDETAHRAGGGCGGRGRGDYRVSAAGEAGGGAAAATVAGAGAAAAATAGDAAAGGAGGAAA